jgi:hypothetical protein
MDQSQRRRCSTLGKGILRRALGGGSGVDELISGITKLKVEEEELTLDIELSEDHLSREETGTQAHELVKFWDREDLDSVDVLWGKEERGEERKGIEFWKKKLLKNNQVVAKNRHTQKIPQRNHKAIVKYLLSKDAASPWFKVQDFKNKDVFPKYKKINAADVIQGDLGDCYFACATSLCAEHYPTCMRNRIETTEDGFKVFLWSQRRGSCNSRSPIMRKGPIVTDVSSLFFVHTRASRKGPKGTPLYLRSRLGALYPMILEKAWVRRRQKELNHQASYEDISNDMGFDAGDVIHVLTGLETDCVRVGGGVSMDKMTPSQRDREVDKMWNLITSALSEGRAVAGGTFATGEGRDKLHAWINEELLSHHNYCILDAGIDSIYGRFLVLRNPQGVQTSAFMRTSTPSWPPRYVKTTTTSKKDDDEEDCSEHDGYQMKQDGVFRMCMKEFMLYFSTVSYVSETCDRYPKKLCHRYRKHVSNPDRVRWCNRTVKLDDEETRRRKLSFVK